MWLHAKRPNIHKTNQRIANLSPWRKLDFARLTKVQVVPRRTRELTLATIRSVMTDASLGEYPAIKASIG